MIARVCAAQVARQIVRALHVPAEQAIVAAAPVVRAKRKQSPKGRKKKKVA